MTASKDDKSKDDPKAYVVTTEISYTPVPGEVEFIPRMSDKIKHVTISVTEGEDGRPKFAPVICYENGQEFVSKFDEQGRIVVPTIYEPESPPEISIGTVDD